MLTKLGCDVVTLSCEPSGYFPRGSEPIRKNLGDLVRTVKAEGTALGIAHDGDGDRIAVIDDKGRFIAGDKLLVLFARQLGVKKVVTTIDASQVTELGFEVIRTRVGDAFVSEELKKGGDFGGEPSGCFIFPRVSFCPDGIYAAAKIVQLASEHRISSLVDQMPSYSVLRGSVPGDKATMERLEERLKETAPLSLNTLDGLRLDFGDGWLLIRPSGTEPKIRITAEAKSEERANELYNLGFKAIEECLMEQERAMP